MYNERVCCESATTLQILHGCAHKEHRQRGMMEKAVKSSTTTSQFLSSHNGNKYIYIRSPFPGKEDGIKSKFTYTGKWY